MQSIRRRQRFRDLSSQVSKLSKDMQKWEEAKHPRDARGRFGSAGGVATTVGLATTYAGASVGNPVIAGFGSAVALTGLALTVINAVSKVKARKHNASLLASTLQDALISKNDANTAIRKAVDSLMDAGHNPAEANSMLVDSLNALQEKVGVARMDEWLQPQAVDDDKTVYIIHKAKANPLLQRIKDLLAALKAHKSSK